MQLFSKVLCDLVLRMNSAGNVSKLPREAKALLLPFSCSCVCPAGPGVKTADLWNVRLHSGGAASDRCTARLKSARVPLPLSLTRSSAAALSAEAEAWLLQAAFTGLLLPSLDNLSLFFQQCSCVKKGELPSTLSLPSPPCGVDYVWELNSFSSLSLRPTLGPFGSSG